MMKKLALALASTLALVACGDDSSSGIFSMENSFEMVLDKAKYSYSKKDSTFKRIEPICKEGTLGNLVGPADTDVWDTLTYKVHENKGVITLKNGPKDPAKYNFSSSSFPVGFWADPENTSKKIQGGFTLTKKDMMNRVIRYDGSCFMKDYYSLFGKEVEALYDMDKTLTAFYGRFQNDDVVDQKQMIADIRAVDCDELSLYDGLVKLSLEDFKESSGTIVIKYAKRTCDVSFHIRYAFEQEDCVAAYEDFKNDRNAASKFEFGDYAFDVTYSGDDGAYCLDYLVLDLKSEKGIQKSIAPKDFARGIVKMIVNGMK